MMIKNAYSTEQEKWPFSKQTKISVPYSSADPIAAHKPKHPGGKGKYYISI